MYLYYSAMSTDTVNGGINFNSAAAIGQKYSVIAGHGDYPVNYVTFYSSLRFANWLNNGQGNASTEMGSYTLGTLGPGAVPIDGPAITRNADAHIAITSENEWYKAAYYNPVTKSYFEFPTSSNTLPTPVAPAGTSNSANFTPGGWPTPDYADAVGHLTPVGAYTSTMSPYGTFDQGGDVWQWNESLLNPNSGSTRGIRGGQYSEVWDHMVNFYRGSATADFGWYAGVGFRVVMVPEPSPVRWRFWAAQ